MASIEYCDLYYKAQENDSARYHVFTFDLVNSTKMSREGLNNSKVFLKEIVQETYNILKEIEKIESRNILVFEEGFKSREEYFKSPSEGFGLKFEPFGYGDMMGFTIYRGSMTREEVLDIFDSVKRKYNYEYQLHYADGYYETNNYEEGDKLFFRGYCIDILSNLHKPYVIQKLKKTKRVKK